MRAVWLHVVHLCKAKCSCAVGLAQFWCHDVMRSPAFAACSASSAHTCVCFACRYISALLLSLSTMLHLELPHVNVLSKVDLVPQYGQLGEWGSLQNVHNQ
jgi:hypothetical protein